MNYQHNILRAEYFDKKAIEWGSKKYIGDQQHKVLAILSRYNIQPAGIIVDVGCGTGVLSPLLSPNAKMIISLDSSLEMLRHFCGAKNTAPVLLIQCFAEEIPLPDAFADWVIFYSSFPHISDKIKTLGEAHRILKPEGNLVIFHTVSRIAINQKHSRLPFPLCNDLLPRVSELTEMSQQIGFKPLIMADNEQNYFYAAKKLY